MDRIEGASVGRCAASPYLRPLTLHYRQNGAQKSWDFMKTHDSVTVLLFNSSRRSLVLVKQFRPAVYAGEVERHFPGSLAAVDQDRPRELQPALPGSAGVTVELCAGLVDQPGLSLEEVACKEAWEECGYHLAPSDLRRVATYWTRCWDEAHPLPQGHYDGLLTPAEVLGKEEGVTESPQPHQLSTSLHNLLQRLGPTPLGEAPEVSEPVSPAHGPLRVEPAALPPQQPQGLHLGAFLPGSGVGLTGSRQTMFYTEVTDAQRSGPGGGLAEEGELIEVVHLPLEGAQAFADDPDIPKTLGVIFGVSWFLSQVAPNLDLQ
ncbi:uridine diphosphate glucose pyrophosphatase NUDT14 isoform X1 [Macaca mulatta]